MGEIVKLGPAVDYDFRWPVTRRGGDCPRCHDATLAAMRGGDDPRWRVLVHESGAECALDEPGHMITGPDGSWIWQARGAGVVTWYGAFNDVHVWEELFASGALDESQRFQLDQPLYEDTSLAAVARYARLRNVERAEQDKMGTYGLVVVQTWTVTTSPRRAVTAEEIADAPV